MVYRPAQVYNGSGWDDVGDKRMLTHDHSGGADGTNIPQSSVTDLTSDLASKLTYPSGGSNGNVLTKSGTAAAWTALSTGKILQVVRATDSTNRSTTSSSFVDVTGMSVTITPETATSAIIVLASFNYQGGTGTSSVLLADGSNNALSGAEDAIVTITSGAYGTNLVLAYVTPATTSAVSYKLRFRSSSGTFTIRNSSVTGQIYAIEVSA